jgi:hypothetical protein
MNIFIVTPSYFVRLLEKKKKKSCFFSTEKRLKWSILFVISLMQVVWSYMWKNIIDKSKNEKVLQYYILSNHHFMTI